MKSLMLGLLAILCFTACSSNSSEEGGVSEKVNVNMDSDEPAEDVDLEQLADDFYKHRKELNFGKAVELIHPVALEDLGREKWLAAVSKAKKLGKLEKATLSRKEEAGNAVFLYYEVQFAKKVVYERVKFQAKRNGGWAISGFAANSRNSNFDNYQR